MGDPSNTKAMLRTAVRDRLRALDAAQRRQASMDLCRALAHVPALVSARCLLVYLPLPSEVDVLPFARLRLTAGAEVAVPRLITGGGGDLGAGPSMEVVAVERLPGSDRSGAGDSAAPVNGGGVDSRATSESDSGFVVDRLGVRSPAAGVVLPPSRIDAAVVPGLAFDARGGRLGRGGGFYDRWLAGRSPRCVVVGVCFEVQIVEQVPMEPHDARVDMVLTERRLVYTRAAEPASNS